MMICDIHCIAEISKIERHRSYCDHCDDDGDYDVVDRPTQLICISDIYLSTYKYKRHRIPWVAPLHSGVVATVHQEVQNN